MQIRAILRWIINFAILGSFLLGCTSVGQDMPFLQPQSSFDTELCSKENLETQVEEATAKAYRGPRREDNLDRGFPTRLDNAHAEAVSILDAAQENCGPLDDAHEALYPKIKDALEQNKQSELATWRELRRDAGLGEPIDGVEATLIFLDLALLFHVWN